jgi:hypothetical protein
MTVSRSFGQVYLAKHPVCIGCEIYQLLFDWRATPARSLTADEPETSEVSRDPERFSEAVRFTSSSPNGGETKRSVQQKKLRVVGTVPWPVPFQGGPPPPLRPGSRLRDQARDALRAIQSILDRARMPNTATRGLHTAGIQNFGDLCERCGAGSLSDARSVARWQ